MRIVQGAPAAAGTVAQPHVAAGFLGEHVGEVLGTHRRQVVHTKPVGTEQFAGHTTTDFGFGSAVDGRRITMIEAHRDLRPESAGDAGAQAFDRPLDQRLRFAVEAADRAPQHRVVGDDVPRFAGVHLRDTDHRRLARMHVASDDGLQGQHQLAADHQRINALVRHRGMATMATHRDLESAGSGHHRPGHHRHLTDRDSRPVVQAKHGVYRKRIEQAVGYHHRRATLRLLGGLEDEVYAAVEVELVHLLGHVARSAKQHRRVPVMTTGVHQAGTGRSVGEIVLLQQRQRIHIGAKPYRPRTATLAQGRDNARPGQAAMDLQSVAGQLACHQIGGAPLIESELGVGVYVAPNGGKVGEKRNL